MSLNLMYITNNPEIALIAEASGVTRIWIDLETLGKEERQKGMNTVKSKHTVEDIKQIRPLLTTSKMMVRVNPIHENSKAEIDAVIEAGAEYIMLPMWKSENEVAQFISMVNGRCKTMLLLETKEGEECLDKVLEIPGIDEIHIGLNDLHLSYKLDFMFELLANGKVDSIIQKIKAKNIPYGFGGVSHLGDGMVPAEMILKEHIRLGSSMVILSRGFCDITKPLDEIRNEFSKNLKEFRAYEEKIQKTTVEDFKINQEELKRRVNLVVEAKNKKKYQALVEAYGEAFYLLDSKQFKENFINLKKAFSTIYPKFNIAYSYKTNYTPKLCKIVDSLGGYAEVVSEMELELALGIGVEPKNIIWNGPIKNEECLKEYLKLGVVVNIDNKEEMDFIQRLANEDSSTIFNLGIRCNFDVNDGVVSRFGFDIESDDFRNVVHMVTTTKNIHFVNFQCHFAKRNIEYWPQRAKGIIAMMEQIGVVPERVDIGGGLFGHMAPQLKAQFTAHIPTYKEYAEAVATVFADYFKDKKQMPEVIIEPGSALVGDCMQFIGTVKNIKNVRGKSFATVLGSQKNISMTGVNPPIRVIHMSDNAKEVENLDFVGFTCIEGDVLYRGYNGTLANGDIIEISNCGSYSLVMKPPFILPNFPVLDISEGGVEVIKRKECFDDLFHTFNY